MKSVPSTLASERVYSLDAFRAVMMLLGIVLHAAITYGSGDYREGWPFKAPDNTVWFHLLASAIHAFRMPAFFVASGYFSALLFDRKGASAMLTNRFRRLALPFVAALFVCYPLSMVASSFSTYAFAGAAAPFRSALAAVSMDTFLPQRTLHLWFIYYLILFILIAWLMATTIRKESLLVTAVTAFARRVLQHFVLRTGVISLLFFFGFLWIGGPAFRPSMGWPIGLDMFMTYFMFFGIGWMIYTTKTLAKMATYPAAQLTGAVVLFLVFVCTPWPAAAWTPIVLIGIAAACGTLFIFGFIAFFQRYFNRYSPVLNYLMEASYWVYIIHLPIVLFIPGLLADLPLPVLLKFGIVVFATTTLSLLSYHFLVRNTVVGLFLYGKVHKRRTGSVLSAQLS